jgi:protein JBTS26
VTTNDSHMWMVPFTKGQDHWITVDFKQPVKLSALRFHNYNKRAEDTQRGVKLVTISLDDADLSAPSGLVLRQAPGRCAYDFGQTIQLHPAPAAAAAAIPPTSKGPTGKSSAVAAALNAAASARRNMVLSRPDTADRQVLYSAMPFYNVPYEPAGLLLSINILSTWGDLYYVGLNGIQLLDPDGRTAFPTSINAIPSSVNVLLDSPDDPRVVANVLDGSNVHSEDEHAWLTPFVPGTPVIVSLSYDRPVTIGTLRLWNYGKTAIRGVRQFQMVLDGNMIFEGSLAQVKDPDAVCFQSVLFSGRESTCARERGHLIQVEPERCPGREIRLTDNGHVLEEETDGPVHGGVWSASERPATAAAVRRA